MKKRSLAILSILAAVAIALAALAVAANRPGEASKGAPQASKGAPQAAPAGAMPASGKRGAGGFPGGMPGFGAGAQAAKSVRASAAGIGTLRPYIDRGGDVEASVSMSVYPDIGGRLADLEVSIGDNVAKGQRIASVDPSKPGSSYALSPVEAPISGTVTELLADPGETVTSTTAIAKVGVISDLEITVYIPERDSIKVKKGMAATVSLEALPGESLAATVVRVSPVLDPSSRTREATLKLDSRDGRVAAGMYASVRIFTTPISGAILVPTDAIVSRDDETFVYVVADEGGKKVARRRIVEAGSSVDELTSVDDGVAAGELVVYEGQDLLSEGVEVSVIGEDAE